MAANGQTLTLGEILACRLYDRLGDMMWMLSDKRGDRPESLLDRLTNRAPEPASMAFYSPEAFEAEKRRLLGR